MKKKLTLGFSILLLIFIIGGIIVIKNFWETRENQKLISLQETAILGYEGISLQSLDAIRKINQYQAGFTKDLEPLIQSIGKLDQDIEFLERKYYSQYQNLCQGCHKGDETEVLPQLERAFRDVKKTVEAYKFALSMLITTADENLKKKLEREIFNNVERVIAISENLAARIAQMKEHLKNTNVHLIKKSEITLAVTFISGSLLSLLVIVLIYRSLNRPINILINGTEAITRGNYWQNIPIKSRDEIGTLARRFNYMASSLLKRDQALKESYSCLEQTNEILKASRDELEEHKKELERKVEERTEKLREMQKHFVRCETLAAVGKMAAGISHELSSPLGTILGFTQILMEETDPSNPKRKDLDNIQKAGMHCEKIVKGLLGFSRIQDSRDVKVSIDVLMSEILDSIIYQPALKKITVILQLQEDLPQPEIDPEELKHVFLNIIMNAVQAMPEGGNLIISGRYRPPDNKDDLAKMPYQGYDNGYLDISFTDTGCGIDPAHLNRIFEPFFTTKTSEQGTGLGLSISQSIIERYGGKIEVKSQSGHGSTFSIILPV